MTFCIMIHSWRVLFTTLLLLKLLFITMSNPSVAEEIDVWLGTGGAPSQGIYHCLLNTETGKLSPSRLVAEISSPGFLALHPNGSHLYSIGTLQGVPSVVAYRIKSRGEQAELLFDNSLATGDGNATHLSVDSEGKMLITAQYGAGSTAAFELMPGGELSRRTSLIKHQGGSRMVADRQDAPHAHWAGFAPDERFVLVPDLGLDQVLIYQVDKQTCTLTYAGAGVSPPGAGPRHMKFHPNGRWIYVINELDLSLSLFDYMPASGEVMLKQTIPTVSKEELADEQFTSGSEVRIHPSGRFVYAANRGHDTITVFAVAEDGQLSEIQNEPIRGATPRNFNIDPSGRWLLAAGQESHTLASFAMDQETGKLTYNRSIIQTPTPICVLFQHE